MFDGPHASSLARCLSAAFVVCALGVAAGPLAGSAGGAEAADVCGKPGPGQGGRQQRDATRDYLTLWTRSSRYLGSSGEPAPRLRYLDAAAPRPGPKEPMWVGPDEDGCRTIFITPGPRTLLAKSKGDRRARRLHRVAERWVIHEMAHYFQSDEVLRDTSLREFGATQWEKAHSRVLLGTRKHRVNARYNRWRDRDQFGPRFGQNPLTFRWPSAPVTPD
ncbi:MAG: hypothetical protein ACXWFN_05775 [Solirubrobacterales bacterium]